MPYLSPGVYVEEVPAAQRPIAGVGTSTAGFLGVVPDDVVMPFLPGHPLDPDNPVAADFETVAPAGDAELVTNWEQFKTKFGGFQEPQAGWAQAEIDAYRQFQLAVFGFFLNGGTRCWCLRTATVANLQLPANLTTNLNVLAGIDEIAMVAAPGQISNVFQDALVAHCVLLEDRVAILDGQPDPADLTPIDIRGGAGNATQNSDYAAMYFPWIQVGDPLDPNARLSQPPSGHIAGIYARSDARVGVHKAPANEYVRGAVDVLPRLTRNEQDGLNPEGINVIRVFNGDIKVWGARTLGGDAHGLLKYISTRRYRNYLRESIDEGTQWVVFEPNTPELWQRIKRSVSGFLTTEWSEGRLFGETVDKAFFVKVDEENNPPAVRDLGQVIIEVGVAIVQPAEFVIFRIEQISGS